MAVAARRAPRCRRSSPSCAGVALSGQAYINGRLGESIGSGEARGGRQQRRRARGAARGHRWRSAPSRARCARWPGVRLWHLLGGLGGAMFIAAGAIGAPEIGVALLSVALVCGQTTGSLVADGVGLSPAGHQGVTTGRVAGVALTIAAVVASALGASAHLHVGAPRLRPRRRRRQRAAAGGQRPPRAQHRRAALRRHRELRRRLPRAARRRRDRDRPRRRPTAGRPRRWSTRPACSAPPSRRRWPCSSRAWASCA